MFKVGDKVLVEGVVKAFAGKAWEIELAGYTDCVKVFVDAEMRPWTEKPPASEVWRGKDKDGDEMKVLSDGSAWFISGENGGSWVEAKHTRGDILAEYVRQTAKT